MNPDAEPEANEASPYALRFNLPEFLLLLVLTGALLFAISQIALTIYFRTAGLRPGILFLNLDVGGLAADAAQEKMVDIAEASFRFPILLTHGQRKFFLHYQDHYRFEIDTEKLLRIARTSESTGGLWERAQRHLRADFEPLELPWEPTLDREYTRPRIAKLLESHSQGTILAYPEPDGLVRLVVSNQEDEINTILDLLEGHIQAFPRQEHRRLKSQEGTETGEITRIDPEDPEKGFRHVLATAKIAIPLEDPWARSNLQVGVRALEHQIVNPFRPLDFLSLVGPVSPEAGYQTPPEFPWRTGHGLERLAAVFFQAMIEAGCEQVDRTTHTHYGPELAYVDKGMDVRILPEDPGGGLGRLVLRNPWTFPLRLRAWIHKGFAWVQVRGLKELEQNIEIRVGLPEKVPYKTEITRDPELPRGQEEVRVQGLDGFTVKIFRKVHRDGGLPPRETMLGAKAVEYEPRTGVIVLGTGSPGARFGGW